MPSSRRSRTSQGDQHDAEAWRVEALQTNVDRKMARWCTAGGGALSVAHEWVQAMEPGEWSTD